MIKNKYIELVKDEVEIVTLFKDLYPEAKLIKSGIRYKCRCVFHNETDASLYIDPVLNSAHCFGCNSTFDVVGLAMEKLNLSFPEAIIYLLKEYCRVSDLSDIYQKLSPEETQSEKARESQIAAMQYVQEFYTKEYYEDSIYARYCRNYAERSIDNPSGRWDSEKIKTFGFGYAPASGHALVDWASKKGLDLDTLVDIGVATCHEDGNHHMYYRDLFRDRLVIPQRNSWSKVIAYTARRLADTNKKDPKYMNSTCSQKNLIQVSQVNKI